MVPGSPDPAELFAAFSQAKSAGKSALFLAGPIGSGKTKTASLLAKILSEKGFSVAGIVSPRILKDGKTLGYVVRDIYTGRTLPLCAVSPHELFLLMKTISPSSEPSPPLGEKGLFFLNPLRPLEEEKNEESVPREPTFSPNAPLQKRNQEPGEDEDKASLPPILFGATPLDGDRFSVPVGGNFSPIPSPPGGEGQGEGEIFRFRRFFFSQQALDFGNSVLKEAAEKAKVIVVDEVGPLELSGHGFAPGLRVCRESQAFLILTVRPHLLSSVKRWLGLESAEVLSLQGKGQE